MEYRWSNSRILHLPKGSIYHSITIFIRYYRRYGIKTFPALVYFRNGNPLTFDGDLKSEESVLEWLVDDDNRELEDEIEAVNFRMLDKLLSTSPLIAVFFCRIFSLDLV